jgi:hypothetical protein
VYDSNECIHIIIMHLDNTCSSLSIVASKYYVFEQIQQIDC